MALAAALACSQAQATGLDEILRDNCADAQAKVFNKFQTCVIKGYLLTLDEPAAIFDYIGEVCGPKLAEKLEGFDTRYQGKCEYGANSHETFGTAVYLVEQTVCAMDFFLFGDNPASCEFKPPFLP